MRTDSTIHMASAVAIETQNLKITCRKTMFFEPTVNSVRLYFAAMARSIAANMIYRQKGNLRFSTARTFATVCRNHLSFESLKMAFLCLAAMLTCRESGINISSTHQTKAKFPAFILSLGYPFFPTANASDTSFSSFGNRPSAPAFPTRLMPRLDSSQRIPLNNWINIPHSFLAYFNVQCLENLVKPAVPRE
jgi:hypothetical protein